MLKPPLRLESRARCPTKTTQPFQCYAYLDFLCLLGQLVCGTQWGIHLIYALYFHGKLVDDAGRPSYQNPGGGGTLLVITWSVSPQHLSFYLSAGRTPFPSYRPSFKRNRPQHVLTVNLDCPINVTKLFISCLKICCFYSHGKLHLGEFGNLV